jgi:hypothetical protein
MPFAPRLDLSARAAELVPVRDVNMLPDRLTYDLAAPPVVRGAVLRHALPAVDLEAVTPILVTRKGRKR